MEDTRVGGSTRAREPLEGPNFKYSRFNLNLHLIEAIPSPRIGCRRFDGRALSRTCEFRLKGAETMTTMSRRANEANKKPSTRISKARELYRNILWRNAPPHRDTCVELFPASEILLHNIITYATFFHYLEI